MVLLIIMDNSSIDPSKVRNLFVIIVSLSLSLLIYASVKNFFLHYFTRIEKRQSEIIAELKKIKTNAASTQPNSPTFTVIQEIGAMKEEIARLKDQVNNKEDILGLLDNYPIASPTPTISTQSAVHFVSIINSKWQSVDVFQDKNSSSKIVGQAVYNKSYLYTKKESGYYYINLSDSVSGWIHSQFVKEY